MSKVYARYRPVPMSANGSETINGASIAGFLPTASGTLTVTDADGTVLLNGFAVTAGTPVTLAIAFNTSMGGTVSLASNAAGTLMV